MTTTPTETCDACKGAGHLGQDDRGKPQICDYCAGEGVVPKLTPEQRAELIAKAEKATAALAGAGKLEGPQLGRFVQLLNAESGGTFKLPLPKTVPLPEGVQVRPATDEEQRFAIERVYHSFKVPAELIRQVEADPPFSAIDAMAGIDRLEGFPVWRGHVGADTCPHGAGAGAICPACVFEHTTRVPNRPLLIVRLLELAAIAAEAAHAEELPGQPVIDTDFSDDPPAGRTIPATLELLQRVTSALDMARGWATDRQVCFAAWGRCACAKCAP